MTKIKSISIDHIAIYAEDLEGMRDFFIHFFHAKSNELYCNTKTGFCSYFLSFDNQTRIEIMNSPEMVSIAKALKQQGYSHISFSVGGKEEVDKLTKELVKEGYYLISGPRTTGDGYYESCILGPEENQIEITE